MATLVSVTALILTNQPLTPANVFMLHSFITILQNAICHRIGNGFVETYEAYVSLCRIEAFLLLENLRSLSCNETEEGAKDMERNSAKLNARFANHYDKTNVDISIVDEVTELATDKPVNLCVSHLTYEPIDREYILQDIEFTSAPESLTVITGPVGSGKSSLLSAIAGEVSDTSGTITFQGCLVYVPQIAWVFSGSIRENVLFGDPYDEDKFNRTIDACALSEDIQQFPDREHTIVGERGVVLSGGQRARVSLARAVYADADLYLLDDPLSAVDFKVGRHIFENCIKGVLAHKTILLTSHQEQHMKQADQVIVLYKGRMLEKGQFAELLEKGVLGAIVDPLYKKVSGAHTLDEGISWSSQSEENSEFADIFCTKEQPSKEGEGLEISQEDRVIGVVTARLYWNYFTSGMHWLLNLLAILLCLITQGRT